MNVALKILLKNFTTLTLERKILEVWLWDFLSCYSENTNFRMNLIKLHWRFKN